MDINKVKRLYELRHEIGLLQKEEKELTKEIKIEMLTNDINQISVGNIDLELKMQNKTIINKDILIFLKAKGYEEEVNKYVVEKDVDCLYIKYAGKKDI